MSRGRRKAPEWVQMLIVWVVVSGLGTMGVLFLRSRDVLSDAIFQPLVPALCKAGDRIETRYSSRVEVVDNRGRASMTGGGRQLIYTGLDAASCLAPDGTQLPAAGFTPAVLGIGGLVGGGLVGLMAMSRRR